MTDAPDGARPGRELVSDLTAMFDALDHVFAIIQFDPRGTVLAANDNFLNLFGYSPEEITGKHHRMFCEPSYVATPAYQEHWQRLARGEFRQGEFKRLARDGRETWIRASYSPVSDDQGRVVKVIKLATDVTAEKLRSFEQDGKVAAVSRAQAVIEFSLDGTVLDANQNFLDVMGYRLDEVRGKHHKIFCERRTSDDPDYRDFWDALRSGEYMQGEFKRLGKGGREVWINASYNPIFDADGKPFKIVKYATDVTTARLASAELGAKVTAVERSQAVVEFDLHGLVLTANENFVRTLGYTLEEIRGKHHGMFCTEETTRSADYQEFWRKLAKGEFVQGEFMRLAKNGREVWINASYNPVFDLSGRPYKVVKFATEVTDQKLAAAEIEGKLVAVGKAQAVIEFSPDGTVLAANENFLKVTGYDSSEVIGKHHRMFCDPEYARTADYAEFWRRLAAGHLEAGEYKRFGKGGKEVWINASYNPIFDARGRPFKVVKYATEVTREKLRAAEFEGIFSAIGRSQAVIEFDLDGTILEANENFLAVTGYTRDEVRGRHHGIFCDPDHVASPAYTEFWNSLRRGDFSSGEFKRYGKGRKEIWIRASYNPIFDMNGRPFKVVKFASDVTAQKLESAEFEVKVAAMNTSQAMIEFTMDGFILNANDNFLKATGYTLDEIVGKHHRMFCDRAYAESAPYRDFWAKLGRGEFASGRFRRVDRTGRELWLSAMYYPIRDMNGKAFKVTKFAVDITEQVALEREVKRLAEEFSASARQISERTTGVSRSAQSLGATTEEMSASVDELSASIGSIAKSTGDADQMARSTQRDAETGMHAIRRSIEAMELINRSSDDIGAIVAVISEIAAQTNLLAFNAAIEAARAGEHGLGFSVVADEVRKLAERSSAATKDISKLIQETVKRVGAGSEVSKEANAAFERILAGVSRTTETISQISAATQEQMMAAREVSGAIQRVAEQAESSATANQEISHSALELLSGAGRLSESASRLVV